MIDNDNWLLFLSFLIFLNYFDSMFACLLLDLLFICFLAFNNLVLNLNKLQSFIIWNCNAAPLRFKYAVTRLQILARYFTNFSNVLNTSEMHLFIIAWIIFISKSWLVSSIQHSTNRKKGIKYSFLVKILVYFLALFLNTLGIYHVEQVFHQYS